MTDKKPKEALALFDAAALQMAEARGFAKGLEAGASNAHLPTVEERMAWVHEREHCHDCFKVPIEPDRRGWARPCCHECMPDLPAKALR